MKWFKMHTNGDALQCDEVMQASNEEVGIWVRMIRYCAYHETGGIIKGCRSWTERQWMSQVNIDASNVKLETKLWSFKGDDIEVFRYPQSSEDATKSWSAGGKKGMKSRYESE